MGLKKFISNQIEALRAEINPTEIDFAEGIFNDKHCQILTQSGQKFEFLLSPEHAQEEVSIFIENEGGDRFLETNTGEWNRYSFACLLQMSQELELLDSVDALEHKKYSKNGMRKRVLSERMQKALNAKYRIQWADNIYGDHILTNENGVKYKVFLRDFKKETGYSDCKDSAINKLGTTKHIMHVFHQLKENPSFSKRLHKKCPFIEIYLDPLNDNRISYFYPHEIEAETKLFLSKFFKDKTYIDDEELLNFTDFLTEAQFFDTLLIRPEVKEKIEKAWEDKSFESIRKNFKPDFSLLNATLYDYQKQGIVFGTTRKHAIIADEMGLGKTIQAIGIAASKRDLFGFKKTLVVCPASLKAQWKSEIEKFTNLEVCIIEGNPEERAHLYLKSSAYFLIVNYETVLRDQVVLNRANIDFLILDEAQKIKNYATKTASAIKNISRKHVLVITGTPIENKLIDIFSIMAVLDPHFLGPLWEFSYQYCLFDNSKINKINGYYNLKELKEKLKPVLLRREKRKVIEELPNVQQFDVPVGMTPLQADYHSGYARGIAQIIRKKFMTAYDMRRLQQLLAGMRMVCDSTYLIDEETFDSPKLDELKYMLLEKLDLKNQNRKIIIFSEWVKVHKLIGQMLRENNIGFTELNGKVQVKKRGELIKRFETDDTCKVFLSTEAGGAGLNLQMADTLINFELPWNPAKKNQRIGRIDRLGQKSSNLTIFNFITENSIERRIALGLLIKQSLFDSVLNEGSDTDFVDFSEKGRSQFLQQLDEMVSDFDKDDSIEEEQTQVEEEIAAGQLSEEELSEDNIETRDAVQDIESPEEDIKAENENLPQPAEEPVASVEAKAKQMEEVMNNGMQFLSGMFQMATGKSLGMEDQKIEINKETGEVTMKFKLPI